MGNYLSPEPRGSEQGLEGLLFWFGFWFQFLVFGVHKGTWGITQQRNDGI